MSNVLAEVLPPMLAASGPLGFLLALKPYFLIFVGFSLVIFVHELGHFMVAKWAGVRVERFAIGFGRELFGFTKGETRYSFNILPLGGYVKMLGQEDFAVDKTGEIVVREDPRSFPAKSVGARMAIVSAGVVMNILFAALIFMFVYMVGKQEWAPMVGPVIPESPAARAGIQTGDRVVSINGHEIGTYLETKMAVVLAPPREPLEFIVERRTESGQWEEKRLSVTPEPDTGQNMLQVGFAPGFTRQISLLSEEYDPDREDTLHQGDTVLEVNGEPIDDENANFILFKIIATGNRAATMLVERPSNPEDPQSPTRQVGVKIPLTMNVRPSDGTGGRHRDILGLSPRVAVAEVDPKGRGWLAGFKKGDVVVEWDGVEGPSAQEISESVSRNGERDLRITVLRRDAKGQRTVDLIARPYQATNIWGNRIGRPTLKLDLQAIENGPVVVAGVVREVNGRPTPAARSGIPEGVVIRRVADVEVEKWGDLVDQFQTHAGETVKIAYEQDGGTGEVDFTVPPSITTILDLPQLTTINSVNGKSEVKITVKTEDPQQPEQEQWVSIGSDPYGLRKILEDNIGKTVPVVYTDMSNFKRYTKELHITADMVDPWLRRVYYLPPLFVTQPATINVQYSNPFKAMFMGVKKTVYFVLQAYTTIKRMLVSRSVGYENISGPVGIVKVGSEIAERSSVELLYFLAFLSANLAVLNFLPLPIVDGGLMVFLIVEKIKGTPVSLKTQIVTQVIGLVLIVSAFLLVTFQDILKLAE